jgi:hypothetical protein
MTPPGAWMVKEVHAAYLAVHISLIFSLDSFSSSLARERALAKLNKKPAGAKYMDAVDEAVVPMAGECTCSVPLRLQRIGEGKYLIGQEEKAIFVRFVILHHACLWNSPWSRKFAGCCAIMSWCVLEAAGIPFPATSRKWTRAALRANENRRWPCVINVLIN